MFEFLCAVPSGFLTLWLSVFFKEEIVRTAFFIILSFLCDLFLCFMTHSKDLAATVRVMIKESSDFGGVGGWLGGCTAYLSLLP